MTLPSGYEAVYPRWHRCRQCQRPMLLLVLYYHCLQTAPLNISRALFFFFFYWVCWVTTDGAVRRSNCAAAGISSHKTRNFVLLCTLLSHHLIFFLRIEKKKKKENRTAFWFEATKTKKKSGWRGAKDNSYMSLIVKKKLAAGHGCLIRIVSKTNTATADMEICAVCAQVPTWQIPRPSPARSFSLGSFNAQLSLRGRL